MTFVILQGQRLRTAGTLVLVLCAGLTHIVALCTHFVLYSVKYILKINLNEIQKNSKMVMHEESLLRTGIMRVMTILNKCS
jgi:hypothetical protein